MTDLMNRFDPYDTGVKDANGEAIFEGDRVLYKLEGNHTKKEYWNPEYEVVWSPPGFTLNHVGGGLSGGNYLFMLKYGGGNGSLFIIDKSQRKTVMADPSDISEVGEDWFAKARQRHLKESPAAPQQDASQAAMVYIALLNTLLGSVVTALNDNTRDGDSLVRAAAAAEDTLKSLNLLGLAAQAVSQPATQVPAVSKLHIVLTKNFHPALYDWRDKFSVFTHSHMEGIERDGEKRTVRIISIENPDRLRGLQIGSYEVHPSTYNRLWPTDWKRLEECETICKYIMNRATGDSNGTL